MIFIVWRRKPGRNFSITLVLVTLVEVWLTDVAFADIVELCRAFKIMCAPPKLVTSSIESASDPIAPTMWQLRRRGGSGFVMGRVVTFLTRFYTRMPIRRLYATG
jgi:hypothetical protein